LTWQFKEKLPSIPGYEFDFCNSSALMNVMQVKNGKIVTPSGMSYSLLVLDESAKYMTLPVLKKIRDMVKAGAKVAGIKPEKSPSLSDNVAEFQTIVNGIWGNNNPNASVSQNYSDILKGVSIPEDVIISNAKSRILYVHRQTTDRDIYWLNNRSENTNEAEISFRVTGKTPELWHPQTGKTEKVSYQIKDGRTIFPLKFESWDAFFIVFYDKATATDYSKSNVTETVLTQISTPWKVSFNGKSFAFDKLASWTESTDSTVKYFSGTAVYENSFNLMSNSKEAYVIELGDVKNIAEVIVNGKNMGIAWKKPFRLDITEALKTGDNKIQVRITNLWVNRLIGDAQPGVKTKTTFTTMPFYQANSPLLPSGLLGPVQITSRIKQSN
jgi:hypothetical protein